MFVKVERKYSPWAGNYPVSYPEPLMKQCREAKSKERRRDCSIAADAAEKSEQHEDRWIKEYGRHCVDFVKNSFSRLWEEKKIAGG